MVQGLKLRSIGTGQTTAEPVGWPSPGLDYKTISIYGVEIDSCGFRMNMLDCHSPTIEGYSCLAHNESASIKAIVAHHHGSGGACRQDPRMYESYSFGTWIHMPIDKDEHLEDIWLVSNGKWGSGFMVRYKCLHIVSTALVNTHSL